MPLMGKESLSLAYVGTAGATLDRSFAGGLAPMESSFSRMDFSVATILLVAMSMVCP